MVRVETGEISLERGGGVVLRGRCWSPPPGTRVLGRVVVVHGFGEHGGRYDLLADALCGAGYRVVAVDQRGHGRSPGPRGVLDGFGTLVDDLAAVRRYTESHVAAPGAPFLYAHSLGGLVGLRALQTEVGPWRGAVLSAPWLATALDVPGWKRAAARVLRRVAPTLTLDAGLIPERLTRDPDRIRAWHADPLVHGRVSAGLVARVEEAQREALRHGPPPNTPVLLLLPCEDRVADASVAAAWAGERGGEALRVEWLEGRRHEPHNDVGRGEVSGLVLRWLDAVRGAEQRREEWVSSTFGPSAPPPARRDPRRPPEGPP